MRTIDDKLKGRMRTTNNKLMENLKQLPELKKNDLILIYKNKHGLHPELIYFGIFNKKGVNIDNRLRYSNHHKLQIKFKGVQIQKRTIESPVNYDIIRLDIQHFFKKKKNYKLFVNKDILSALRKYNINSSYIEKKVTNGSLK